MQVCCDWLWAGGQSNLPTHWDTLRKWEIPTIWCEPVAKEKDLVDSRNRISCFVSLIVLDSSSGSASLSPRWSAGRVPSSGSASPATCTSSKWVIGRRYWKSCADLCISQSSLVIAGDPHICISCMCMSVNRFIVGYTNRKQVRPNRSNN